MAATVALTKESFEFHDSLVKFDPDSHTYTTATGGVQVPSVTGILRDVGALPPFATTARAEIAKQRGTMIHRWTQMMEDNNFDIDLAPDWAMNQLEGYLELMLKFQIKTIATEQLVCHPSLRYAGTMDRLFRIYLPRLSRYVLAVGDFKTGSSGLSPYVGLQLAGYAVPILGDEPIEALIGIKLSESGSPQLEEYDIEHHKRSWIGVLEYYTWIQQRRSWRIRS